MKKITLFITFSFILTLSFSQNTDYHWFEKNEKLYFNRHVPAYFWISTNPTDDTHDILLTSSTTKAYANPMYFDSEGYNTFRTITALDTTTGYVNQAIFKIYIDGLPPVPNAYFKGTRRYYSRGKSVYKPGLEIQLSAQDYNSGVDKIMYSLDNQDYTEYSTPVKFTSAGEHTFKYYATDNTGNSTAVKTYNFIIK